MNFPDTFDHHGLLYAKSVEMTTDGKILLEYKCVNHPDVGPEVRGPICSLAPEDDYIRDAMDAIHFQISEAVTSLAILFDQVEKKRGAKAPLNSDSPLSATSSLHLEGE